MTAAPAPVPESPVPLGEAVAPPVRFVPRPDPLYHTVILVLCAGVMILSLLLGVREERQVLVPLLGASLPELCMTKRWTGLGCPGCGMTRAFAWLLRGDLSQALTYHPLAPLIALELLLLGGWWLARRFGRAPELGRLGTAVLAVTAALLLLVWIVRWASGTLPPV